MDLKTLLANMSDETKALNQDKLKAIKRGEQKESAAGLPPSMSEPERTFQTYWTVLGGPELEREYRFDPVRKWRLDFMHVATRTAVEIHGGVFSRKPGRHVRGKGFAGDREKMNAAQAAGITVFEIVTPVSFADVERIHKYVVREIARRREKDGDDGLDREGATTQAGAASQGTEAALDTTGT